MRGKGGGYRLNRSPEEYTVASIREVTAGFLPPVACLENEVNTCPRAAECRTIDMWTKLYKLIDDFFEGVTIADLIRPDDGGNYVI